MSSKPPPDQHSDEPPRPPQEKPVISVSANAFPSLFIDPGYQPFISAPNALVSAMSSMTLSPHSLAPAETNPISSAKKCDISSPSETDLAKMPPSTSDNSPSTSDNSPSRTHRHLRQPFASSSSTFEQFHQPEAPSFAFVSSSKASKRTLRMNVPKVSRSHPYDVPISYRRPPSSHVSPSFGSVENTVSIPSTSRYSLSLLESGCSYPPSTDAWAGSEIDEMARQLQNLTENATHSSRVRRFFRPQVSLMTHSLQSELERLMQSVHMTLPSINTQYPSPQYSIEQLQQWYQYGLELRQFLQSQPLLDVNPYCSNLWVSQLGASPLSSYLSQDQQRMCQFQLFQSQIQQELGQFQHNEGGQLQQGGRQLLPNKNQFLEGMESFLQKLNQLVQQCGEQLQEGQLKECDDEEREHTQQQGRKKSQQQQQQTHEQKEQQQQQTHRQKQPQQQEQQKKTQQQ